MDQNSEIPRRKGDHLSLVAEGRVEFRERGTLLDQVHLVHQALPEMHVDEVDLSCQFLRKKLAAPLMISAMTGGIPEAEAINKDLAKAAQALGIGFGLGSQRAMVLNPQVTSTYQVRDVAPDILLLANLGMVQARQMSTGAIRSMVDGVGADALCIHLNPAMELVQPGGDRDFRGGVETLKRLCNELGKPIIAKETGCGMSRRAGIAAKEAGVAAIDVSGAGGTSWVGVETHRAGKAGDRASQELGEAFWDWGIPTAASIAMLADLQLPLIATGGLRNGMDVARTIALGARLGGLAAPVFRAQQQGGYDGIMEFLQGIIAALRTATFLSGCQRPAELAKAPKVLGADLIAWIEQAT